MLHLQDCWDNWYMYKRESAKRKQSEMEITEGIESSTDEDEKWTEIEELNAAELEEARD